MKAEINMPEILDCGHIPTVPRSDLSTIWHAINRGDNEIARCKRTIRTKL